MDQNCNGYWKVAKGMETVIKITDFGKWVKIDASCVVRADDWKRLRQFILERDNFTCQYCGDKKGPFEADHVMPKSRGGLDKESNPVCACRRCNRSKKDKTPEEWGGVMLWQKKECSQRP